MRVGKLEWLLSLVVTALAAFTVWQHQHCSTIEASKLLLPNGTVEESRDKAQRDDAHAIGVDAPLVHQANTSRESTEPKEPKLPWSDRFVCEAKATDVALVWFTLFLVAVTAFLWRSTESLWEQTRDSVKLARAEFEATHRPKMRIKHVWLHEEIQRDKPIEVTMVAVNVGDLPARITRYDVVACTVREQDFPPNNPFLDPMTQTERAGHKVAQNFALVPSGVTVRLPELLVIAKASASLMDNVFNGYDTFYCFGYIEYTIERAPQNSHFMRTSFCRALAPNRSSGANRFGGAFVINVKHTEYEYQD